MFVAPTSTFTGAKRPVWLARISSARSKFPGEAILPSEHGAARAQVLAAATRRLAREPLGVFAQGLNPSRFDTWMPGLRRKAYRLFPSSTELVKEVLMSAVNPDRAEHTDELVKTMVSIADEAVGPLEAAHGLPTAYIDRILNDDVFRLELTAWLTMPDHPPLRSELRALHASLIDRGAAGLEALVGSYGLEPLAPLTWPKIAAMLLAVVQGTVLSAEIHGDDYDSQVIVNTVMAIIVSTTRPIGMRGTDLASAFVAHCDN